MIEIQINGAYGFDFSVYTGDDQVYRDGLWNVAEQIVETGVTASVDSPSPSLVLTLIVSEKIVAGSMSF